MTITINEHAHGDDHHHAEPSPPPARPAKEMQIDSHDVGLMLADIADRLHRIEMLIRAKTP